LAIVAQASLSRAMPGAPDISVVIPTRDRDRVLDRTLDALERQELGGVEAEVVVVDNGAPEGALARLDGRPVRVVTEPVPGAAAARNRGIAEAGGELILFLGDDCIPATPDLVRGHVEAHAGRDPRAVVGRIEWDPAAERTEVMDWLERAGHIVDMARLDREPAGPATFYTGNVSVPRRALLEVAGFDQRFSGYGWEDLDLALRLADRGLAFEHRAELGIHHSHTHRMEHSLARMEAVGRGARLLHALHDHRRPLPGPPAGRGRLAAGSVFARVGVLRREPSRTLPIAVRDLWMRAAHLGAFARGYGAEPPIDDDPSLRGYGALPPVGGARPAVSVVVPFLEGAAEASSLVGRLGELRLGRGDEVILVDNGGTVGPVGPGGVRVVPAQAERSSYYARNAGADVAENDWLLFLDADTLPPTSLLDDYFREPLGERCGAVAGGVAAARAQRALVARYAASRRYLSQAAHMRDAHRPYGITANLLVRREAWAAVGGFFEGLRSGGDQDLCWRIQDAGWTLEYREPAAVEHRHRERVVPLMRQMARYSAAIAWMARRKPGSSPRPPVGRRLVRSAVGSVGWLALGRAERAAFKALDGVVVVAEGVGYLASNDAAVPGPPRDRALVVDEFPPARADGGAGGTGGTGGSSPSNDQNWILESDSREEVAAGDVATGDVAVEAARRPERPDRSAAGGLRARYAEDDGIARRLLAAAVLAVRDPRRATRVPGSLSEAPAALRLLRARASIAGSGGHFDRVSRLLDSESVLPGDRYAISKRDGSRKAGQSTRVR
jgi:GT2 family glycosyltransferase